MPGLKMADSAVLREKPIFSPRNASVSEWTLLRILKIKISRDTKQLFRKPSLRRMRRLLSLFFSSILLFLLSFFSRYLFFSTNYFSTPPGVCQNKKEPQQPWLDSTILSFSSLWPNRRYSLRRAASQTRQSAMPSPILSPPSLFLRL